MKITLVIENFPKFVTLLGFGRIRNREDTQDLKKLGKKKKKTNFPFATLASMIFKKKFFFEELIHFHPGQSIAAGTRATKFWYLFKTQKEEKKNTENQQSPSAVLSYQQWAVKLLLYTLGAPRDQEMQELMGVSEKEGVKAGKLLIAAC